jgi:DNA-binding transcriptional LysR family regulator
MLNLNLLRTFITVVEEGTLSAAAEKLGLRQPTISLQLQNLEESIGVKLLARRGKGVELTPEGELVLRKAIELITSCERMETEIFEELQQGKVQIRVGAGPIMTDHIFPHVVARFQQAHPGIEVVVEPTETAAIIKGVLDRTYDVGFVGFPLKGDRLELEKWIEDELVLIVPPSHPWAARQSVQPAELGEQSFIWHKGASGIRMFIQDKLAHQDTCLPMQAGNCGEVSSTMSLLSSVNAGLGITIVPRYSAQDAIEMGMVVSVRIEGMSLARSLYIATMKHDRKPAVLNQFIDVAKSYERGSKNGQKALRQYVERQRQCFSKL